MSMHMDSLPNKRLWFIPTVSGIFVYYTLFIQLLIFEDSWSNFSSYPEVVNGATVESEIGPGIRCGWLSAVARLARSVGVPTRWDIAVSHIGPVSYPDCRAYRSPRIGCTLGSRQPVHQRSARRSSGKRESRSSWATVGDSRHMLNERTMMCVRDLASRAPYVIRYRAGIGDGNLPMGVMVE